MRPVSTLCSDIFIVLRCGFDAKPCSPASCLRHAASDTARDRPVDRSLAHVLRGLDQCVVRGQDLIVPRIRESRLVGDEAHGPAALPLLLEVLRDPHRGLEGLPCEREPLVDELLLTMEDARVVEVRAETSLALVTRHL